MTFTQWDKARKWNLRIYGPLDDVSKARYRNHLTVSVVCSKPEDAMGFVASKYPGYRLETCIDQGQIDYIVDTQGVE